MFILFAKTFTIWIDETFFKLLYFFESCDDVTFQEGNSEKNYEALAELSLGWGEQSSIYAELKEALIFVCWS